MEEITKTRMNSRARDSRRTGDARHAAISQSAGFGSQEQAALLLIEVGQDRAEFLRQEGSTIHQSRIAHLRQVVKVIS